MAFTILNNTVAQLTLRELNKNLSKLDKNLKKISTGMKIVSASDYSSAYAISEKMRIMIRSMNQDVQNVNNGKSLLNIAIGGIFDIVDELRYLKELAVNAANDTNTDVDRMTIQKEFDSRLNTIDEIATWTNYNGKRLLDGTYKRQLIADSAHTVTQTVMEDVVVGEKTTTITHVVNEPIPLTAGDYELASDGVYMLMSGFTGIINLTAQNIKFVQETSAPLNNVQIIGPADGGANLWIEDLNIASNQDKNFIKFQGKDNYLNFKGTNTYTNSRGTDIFNEMRATNSAVINVGGGLTVEGGKDGKGIFNYHDTNSTYENIYGAFIGTDKAEDLSDSNIVVNSGNYTTSASRVGAAFIGSAGTGRAYTQNYFLGGKIGDIIINGGTFIDTYKGEANDCLIGGGGSVKNIIIDNATIRAEYKPTDPVIGTTNAYSHEVGEITISNSSIYYRGAGGLDDGKTYSAAIGASHYGYDYNFDVLTGNINIDNCILDIVNTGSTAIGRVPYTNVGYITITNTDMSNVHGLPSVLAGIGRTYSITNRDGYKDIVWKIVHSGMIEPENKTTKTETIKTLITEQREKIVTVEIPDDKHYEWNPLVIHHGTQANQKIHIFIDDMRTKNLKGIIPNESDNERLKNLTGDKKIAYQKLLDKAKDLTVNDVKVTNQREANIAIRVIDGAIEFATNEMGNLSSYYQRLDYMDKDITEMQEHAIASESVIRDANMAKEMTEYTKSNVLAQAAQAVLAQANQNSSSVLSLLQ